MYTVHEVLESFFLKNRQNSGNRFWEVVMSGTCRYGADVSRGIWSRGAISLYMTCNYVFSVKKTPNMENSKTLKVFLKKKNRQNSGVCLVSE